MTAPVLETERLTLRPPTGADARGLIDFLQTDRACHMGGPMALADAWETAAMVPGHWSLRGYGLWAVVPKGEAGPVGTVGLQFPARWPEGEIAWHLWSDAAEWRGLALEAAQAARAHAFGALGWRTAVSYIAPDNARSIRLAQRLGARPEPGAPHPFGEVPCTVWRHPAPGAAT